MVYASKKTNNIYNTRFDKIIKRARPIGKVMNMMLGAVEVPMLELLRQLEKLFNINLLYLIGRVVFKNRWGSKVVPLNVNFAPETKFLPTEEILSIIERSNVWGKAWCYCRTNQRRHGEPNCDHPLYTCLHISPGNTLYEVPFKSANMKKISKEEVIELLKDAEERGLVHQIIFFPSPQFYYVICNCCPCCCLSLSNFFEKGTPQVVKSDFIATTDPNKCTNCGVCEQWCYFGARTLKRGLLAFDPIKCFGCGICVPKCPENAIILNRKNPISN